MNISFSHEDDKVPFFNSYSNLKLSTACHEFSLIMKASSEVNIVVSKGFSFILCKRHPNSNLKSCICFLYCLGLLKLQSQDMQKTPFHYFHHPLDLLIFRSFIVDDKRDKVNINKNIRTNKGSHHIPLLICTQ